MSEKQYTLVIVGIIAFVVICLLAAWVAAWKRKIDARSTRPAFEAWLAEHDYVPDHLSYAEGTGIALKNGIDRFIVLHHGVIRSCYLRDISAIASYVLDGASGGVPGGSFLCGRALGYSLVASIISPYKPPVAQRTYKCYENPVFVLDISLKGIHHPIRIVLETENQMQEWEERLRAYARGIFAPQ